jgi:hypothetical protein
MKPTKLSFIYFVYIHVYRQYEIITLILLCIFCMFVLIWLSQKSLYDNNHSSLRPSETGINFQLLQLTSVEGFRAALKSSSGRH